jgi:hypothetical protein
MSEAAVASIGEAEVSSQLENQEISKAIPVAEDIARFRAEVEERILFSNLPSSEWQQTYQSAFVKYPRIVPYQKIFDITLKSAQVVNSQLNDFWNKAEGEDPQSERVGGVTFGIKAQPDAAKELFKRAFDFEPEDEVEAIKGAIALGFRLSSTDFERWQAITRKPEEIEQASPGALATRIPGFKFGVMILRSDITPIRKQLNFFHEFEHTKNQILESKFLSVVLRKLGLPDEIGIPFYRRESQVGLHSPIARAKDEILAYSSALEFIPAGQSAEDANSFLTKYFKWFEDSLVKETGRYYPKYTRDANYDPDKRAEYVKTVQEGAASIKELFMFYRGIEPVANPGRLAVNVMQQFPLKTWPEVVRLIKDRYSLQGNSGSR